MLDKNPLLKATYYTKVLKAKELSSGPNQILRSSHFMEIEYVVSLRVHPVYESLPLNLYR